MQSQTLSEVVAAAVDRRDFRISNQGSIMIVVSNTKSAKLWLLHSSPGDAQFWGGGMAVEPRYLDGVIDAAESAGFTFEGRS